MAAANAPSSDLDRAYVFNQLDAYPWDDDLEFQGGLRAILGSVQDPAQVDHLTLRAKCYYYARKAGTQVDFDGYKRWVEGQGHGTTAPNESLEPTVPDSQEPVTASESGGMANAPKPASFAEICDMISEGKPIPGIKDIPDTILDGHASESQTSTRQKPWEKDNTTSSSTAQPSWMK